MVAWEAEGEIRKGVRGWDSQQAQEVLGNKVYVHYLNFDDGFTGVNTCPNVRYWHFKYVRCTVCQLYLNKAVSKTKNVKRKWVTLMKKTDKYHLNQVTEVRITSNETNWNRVPPGRMQWE